MAKHRKTRQEKLIADHRHIAYHLETPAQASPSRVKKETQSSYNLETPTLKTVAISYPHVLADMKKTGVVTLIIIFTQILLFIGLNKI